MNALTTCNNCDAAEMVDGDPRGYCAACIAETDGSPAGETNPKHKPIGLPYARAVIFDGIYAAVCPVCEQHLLGRGADPTKDANRRYASHYEEAHVLGAAHDPERVAIRYVSIDSDLGREARETLEALRASGLSDNEIIALIENELTR